MRRSCILIVLCFCSLGNAATFSFRDSLSSCLNHLGQYSKDPLEVQAPVEILTSLAELMVEYQNASESEAAGELTRRALSDKLNEFKEFLKSQPMFVQLHNQGLTDEDFESKLSEKALELINPYLQKIQDGVSASSQKNIQEEATARAVETHVMTLAEAKLRMETLKWDVSQDKANLDLQRQKLSAYERQIPDPNRKPTWLDVIGMMGAAMIRTHLQTPSSFQLDLANATRLGIAAPIAKIHRMKQEKEVSDAEREYNNSQYEYDQAVKKYKALKKKRAS